MLTPLTKAASTVTDHLASLFTERGGRLVRVVAALVLVASLAGVAAASGVALTTQQPEDVGKTSAELHGKVEDWGSHAAGQVGFQYRKQGSSTWTTVWVASATNPIQYSVQVTDLAKGTIYEYRVVAKAGGDTYYGSVVTFTTNGNSNDGGGGSDDGGGGILGKLAALVEAVKGLPRKILHVLFNPFESLAKAIMGVITRVIATYPQVHPNPDVQEIHQLTLTVTFVLSGLAVVATGILFQIGPILGVSYRQARMILPRLVAALVFATVSPFLLQYSVDFADALTQAFRPDTGNLVSALRVSTSLLLVSVIRATMLLIVAVIFVMRDVYLLFAAAISPLIALAWVFPQTKRYADSFIGAWWAALMIGPLDMLVLRLTVNLLATTWGIPHWIWAVGSLTLLVAVPYMVYSASQAIVGQATTAVQSGVSTAGNWRRKQRRKQQRQQQEQRQQHENNPNRRRRSASERRRRRGNNKFSDIINEED